MSIFATFGSRVAAVWSKIVGMARREADVGPAAPPQAVAEPAVSPVVIQAQEAVAEQFSNQPPVQTIQPCPETAQAPIDAATPSPHEAATKTPTEWGGLSEAGYEYIYAREAQQGVSNKLHLPPGAGSGITLGPGYDMGGRTESEVTSDLTAIGVDEEVAKKVAKGAGKKGADAQKFIDENKELINLDKSQEMSLLKKAAPKYMDIVKNNITSPITQDQYTALVSLSYNTGKIKDPIKSHVNNKNHDKAAGLFWIYRRSEGVVIPGLVNRRRLDALLFSGTDEVKNLDFEGPDGVVKPAEESIRRDAINSYGALLNKEKNP